MMSWDDYVAMIEYIMNGGGVEMHVYKFKDDKFKAGIKLVELDIVTFASKTWDTQAEAYQHGSIIMNMIDNALSSMGFIMSKPTTN